MPTTVSISTGSAYGEIKKGGKCNPDEAGGRCVYTTFGVKEEGEKHVRMFDVTSVAFRTLREKKRMADESIGRETDLMYNTVHCQTACTLL